ncbi:MAG: cysteine desulfurase NifS, partial [Nanoarchaeota archaeon]
GSACTSKKIGASHVLLATGASAKRAEGTIRFTLGKYTTEQDMGYVLKIVPNIVKKLRSI